MRIASSASVVIVSSVVVAIVVDVLVIVTYSGKRLLLSPGHLLLPVLPSEYTTLVINPLVSFTAPPQYLLSLLDVVMLLTVVQVLVY